MFAAKPARMIGLLLSLMQVLGARPQRRSDVNLGDLMAHRFGVVPEHGEPHGGGLATRLNWLRAAVLGANDGVVSTAGLVVGVAGATASRSVILTAGLAGLFAGALAMAVGEFVSVSSQRDSERAMLALERRELAETPEPELTELAGLYQAKGLSPELARQVAEQLSAHDALAAHAEAELGINPRELTNPWHAAGASFVAFSVGALLPLVAILAPPASLRVVVTVVVVLAALVATGVASVYRYVSLYAALRATSSISVARKRDSMREVIARTLSRISSADTVQLMGPQSLFQCATKDSISRLRIFTELNVPHRITLRVRMPFQISI